jgi:Domain of unknown function (DUF4232)
MSRRSITPVTRATVSVSLLLSVGVVLCATAGASTSAVGACSAKAIRISLGQMFGAAGTSIQVIDFENLGGSTCSLAGNPVVGFIAVPRSLPEYDAVAIASVSSYKTPSAHPRALVVRPGASASVALVGGDVQIDNRPSVTWSGIEVTIPGQTSGTTFNRAMSSYSGFHVTEFVRGASAGT